MKNYGLTKLFPGLIPVFQATAHKLLNFTDYKYQKQQINNLNIIRDFSILDCIEADLVKLYFNELDAILLSCSKNSINEMVLIGETKDGAYAITSNSINNKIWITVGIGSHYEFENELANRGITVFGFDLNIGKSRKVPENLNLIKKFWGISDTMNSITLNSMLSLANISNGTEWCLKFDIEGSEWELIDQVLNVANMPKIIVCELHDLVPRNDDTYIQDKLAKLKKLSESYIPIFVKPNNYSAYVIHENVGLYDVLEVTWMLRDETIEANLNYVPIDKSLIVLNDKKKPMFPLGNIRN